MKDGRDILKRLVEKERNFRNREFLAPYTGQSRFVIVKMDGMNYRFKIAGIRRNAAGIGRFQPEDPTRARFVAEADDETKRQYLDVLPGVNLILCYETDYGWMAYPMNLQSAMAQIGLDSGVIVRNVTDAERFDVVVARFDGLHFWYDQLALGANAIKSAEMRDAFNPERSEQQMQDALDAVRGVTPEDRKAFAMNLESWKEFRKGLTEERLKEMLELGGGRLRSYVVRGDHIEVNWSSQSGQQYTSLVKKETLDVVVAGICLDPHDGTGPQDTNFHLKDLPFVMRQGEQRQRIVRRPIDMT
jgi:hypothetical protein